MKLVIEQVAQFLWVVLLHLIGHFASSTSFFQDWKKEKIVLTPDNFMLEAQDLSHQNEVGRKVGGTISLGGSSSPKTASTSIDFSRIAFHLSCVLS